MKTAVEWLIEQILEIPLDDSTNAAHLKKCVNKVSVFEKALEMEKKQSKDCFVEKVILKDGDRACCGKEMTDEAAEKYCKEVWLKPQFL